MFVPDLPVLWSVFFTTEQEEQEEQHETLFVSVLLSVGVQVVPTLFYLFVFFNLAVADGDDAVGPVGNVVFVCDDDDGIAFGVEFFE